ncbi:HK97 family phage prohead protease [Nonomuraea sp. NPDC050451]|uniref:HK97 family phage prohead protease n=1 Tax=Nonomuraea sp. NPDC050451 TaxID=3364364 RepID=UPI0037A7D8C1
MTLFTRAFPLDDIAIAPGGDGRTVTAYAAVFDTPAEIHDRDGHYLEEIAASAFDKTLTERGLRFGVFYNHAATLHGTPSERASVPLGTPLEIRADAKGLLTVTRYNRTPLADEVLEAIRNGDITAQSFSGRMIQSKPSKPGRAPYRAGRGGELVTVVRSEIALREYGPTPMPAYEPAAILGVRSLAEEFAQLSTDERAELARMLSLTTPPGAGGDTDTPAEGAVTEESEPEEGHRSGPAMTRARARARLMKRGILL